MAGRMTERRVIQRAADEALMTPRPLPETPEPDDDRDYPPGFGPPGADPGRVGNPDATALPDMGPLAGGYRNRPWYQTKRMFTVLAITVIVALAVWGIIGVLRSPTNGVGDSPAVSPQTGESVPASTPAVVSRGEPIEAAPPPPPPTAEQRQPPANRSEQRPRSTPSRADDKPVPR